MAIGSAIRLALAPFAIADMHSMSRVEPLQGLSVGQTLLHVELFSNSLLQRCHLIKVEVPVLAPALCIYGSGLLQQTSVGGLYLVGNHHACKARVVLVQLIHRMRTRTNGAITRWSLYTNKEVTVMHPTTYSDKQTCMHIPSP